jgi:hypothetical protein
MSIIVQARSPAKTVPVGQTFNYFYAQKAWAVESSFDIMGSARMIT